MEHLNKKQKVLNWYIPSRCKSYNKFLNFIIGGRGIGKTYGFKKDGISHFLKTGKQFVYIRRYKGELTTIGTFLNDMIGNFKDHEFKIKGGKVFTTFQVDGMDMGYAFPLTTYKNLKSSSFPNVDTILFDEFIPEKGGFNQYLANEVEIFLNLVDSLLRNRKGRIYLMANNASIINPYFAYFGIEPNINKEFSTFNQNESVKQILVEICQDKYRKGDDIKTDLQKLIGGTSYGDYNEGLFAYDNDDFIKNKTKSASYLATLFVDGNYYGVWVDYGEGKLYVNTQYNVECPFIYAIGNQRRPNMILGKMWRKDIRLEMIVRNYRDGNLYYPNQTIKQEIGYILGRY